MTLTRSRTIVAAATLLWLFHVVVCLALGANSRGPLLSDLMQFTMGGLLIASIVLAAQRSEGVARAFWQLAIAAYVLWMTAQGFAVYNDLTKTPIVS